MKYFDLCNFESVLFSIHTITDANIGDGDASDFRVTEAQQKCATGLVLQNDVKVLLPNKAKDESAVDNSTDCLTMTLLSLLVSLRILRLLIPIVPVSL